MMSKKPPVKKAKKPPKKSTARSRKAAVQEPDKGVPFEEDEYIPNDEEVDHSAQKNPETNLTPRQEKFCREYVACGVASTAAISAGYNPNSARSQASRLLTDANIESYINHLRKTSLDKYGISEEMIMDELKALAFSNLDDFIRVDENDGTGSIDLRKPGRNKMASLAGYECKVIGAIPVVVDGMEMQREIVQMKIKQTPDKYKALESLAKRAGLLKETAPQVTINNQGKLSDADVVELARKMAFMLQKGEAAAKKEAK